VVEKLIKLGFAVLVESPAPATRPTVTTTSYVAAGAQIAGNAASTVGRRRHRLQGARARLRTKSA
jgi:NAD/NADP transhydrogenase alpha subunit